MLPRQEAAGRTPAAKITFLPLPSLLGGGDQREHIQDFQKGGKGDAVGMKKSVVL